MIYRPEIDGLRTVAVLPVIFFHAGFGLFAGGFVGVDVFFVISGFLITSILLKDLKAGRFSLLTFYERRARRILPALAFVLLCCLPFAWMWMVPSQLREFGQGLVAVALFVSNIHFFRESGYFEPASDENVLLHTWSLAVEEQYYIFFPLLLWVLWRLRHRTILFVFVGIAMVSLALSEWSARLFPDANFYLIHTRAWELFAGSICALVQFNRPRRDHSILAGLGLGLILFSVFAFDKTIPFPSLYALVPVLGTVLIIQFGGPSTLTGRILSLKAMVGIGLISYSAYLWHQPLFAFAHIRSIYPLVTWQLLGLSVLSLVLAYFSWRYIEAPFRTKSAGPGKRLLQTKGTLFAVSGTLIVAMIGIGLMLHFGNGMPNRPIAALRQPLIDAHAETYRSYRLSRNAQLEAARIAAFNELDSGPRVLILGDSHAVDLFNAMVQNIESYPQGTVFLSRDLPLSCGDDAELLEGADKYTHCAERFMQDKADLFTAATHIVLSARWRTKEDPLALISGYARTFRDAGKNVIVFSNTAEFDPQAPDLIRIAAHESNYGTEGEFPKNSTDRIFFTNLDDELFAFNESVRVVVEDQLDLQFVDKVGFICNLHDQTCESTTDSFNAIYYDYGHWTLEGAQYLGQRMIDSGIVPLFETR